MSIEFLAALVAAVVGSLFPLLSESIVIAMKHSSWMRRQAATPIGKTLLKLFQLRPLGSENRNKELFVELARTSSEMDKIVEEIGRFTQGRQATALKLESELEKLSQHERELKQRIEGLEKVPLLAAEYFAQLVEKGEKRNAIRDYGLFLAGIVLTVIVSIILKAYGLA